MEITILAFFHIIFINTVFIVVDYLALTKISKTNVSFLLIAASGLTSLFLSVYFTNHIIQYYFHDQWFGFTNGVVKKSLFITGAFIFTVSNIIIELPFYILATKNKKVGQCIKSSVISNFATNISVGLLYLTGDMFYSHPE